MSSHILTVSAIQKISVSDKIDGMKNRIEEIRRAKRMSMDALALAVSTTASTINKLEKGQMRLTDKWIGPIAKALGVAPGDLFAKGGFSEQLPEYEARPPKSLPVYGLAAASIRGLHRMDNDPIEFVSPPPTLTTVRDAYALIVTGTSMEPRYFAGDLIFVHPGRPVRQGDHVVIQEALDGGTAVSVKRFEREANGELVATQYNPLAEIRFKRSNIIAVHRVMTQNELFGY